MHRRKPGRAGRPLRDGVWGRLKVAKKQTSPDLLVVPVLAVGKEG